MSRIRSGALSREFSPGTPRKFSRFETSLAGFLVERIGPRPFKDSEPTTAGFGDFLKGLDQIPVGRTQRHLESYPETFFPSSLVLKAPVAPSASERAAPAARTAG